MIVGVGSLSVPAEAHRAIHTMLISSTSMFMVFYPRAEFISQWLGLVWLAINRGSFALPVALPLGSKTNHSYISRGLSFPHIKPQKSNPTYITSSAYPPPLTLYAPLPFPASRWYLQRGVLSKQSLWKWSLSCVGALIIPPYKARFYSVRGKFK